MSSSASVTISREAILQRRACSPRRRNPLLSALPLQIISEEEEYLRSRSPSPAMSGYLSSSTSSSKRTSPSLKNRRRHCNLSPSDIQIARDFVGIGSEEHEHESDREDRLLLVPPSSARLPSSSSSVASSASPDSFKLTFTDGSYTFPHPPIPTPSSLKHLSTTLLSSPSFPSSSSSSGGSSPRMPLTPSSSTEDFFQLPSPRFNPRRAAAIQPLIIQRHFHSGIEIEASVPEVYESWEEKVELNARPQSTSPVFSLSPYTSSEEESDNDSDSEWYRGELSQVITITAPSLPSRDTQTRPDSVFLPAPSISSLRGSISSLRAHRDSCVLPPTPQIQTKRTSKRYIPNYPPPPPPVHRRRRISAVVPSSPTSTVDFPTICVSPAPSSSCGSTSPVLSSFAPSSRALSPRPPPRTSVPADFTFDPLLDEYPSSDTESVFSFAMYDVAIDEDDMYPSVVSPLPLPPSHSGSSAIPSSAYSQTSFSPSPSSSTFSTEDDYGLPLPQHFEDISSDSQYSPLSSAHFDLDTDHPLMLPLSLPNTPIDLEAEVQSGLEELRLLRSAVPEEIRLLRAAGAVPVSATPLPPVMEEEEQVVEVEVQDRKEQGRPTTPQGSEKWSFGTPSPARSFNSLSSPPPTCSFTAPTGGIYEEERLLKSKWSSSTLASVRSEHAKRSSSSRLKLFLGSPSKKRTSTSGSGSPTKKDKEKEKVPTTPTPMSPMGFMMKKRGSTSGSRKDSVDYPSMSMSMLTQAGGYGGYGGQQGVRRRGSTSTISDSGSVDTVSTSGSSGLRRKPIPVELFLRR